MRSFTKRALRVSAALAELRGRNADVLDALVPFFEPILEVMNKTVFSPRLLATGVRRLYKWNFTTDVAEAFIPRLLKMGYLTQHGTPSERVYIVDSKAQTIDRANERNITLFLDEVITAFSVFSPKVTDLLHYNRTREELTDVLIRFLISEGAFASWNGSSDVADDLGALNDVEDGGAPLSSEDRYITARFIRHYLSNFPNASVNFERLAAVGLLMEVADDFARPVDSIEKTDLKIILDAPIALDYLGLSGKDYKQDVGNVLDSLRERGASIHVFPTTCDEMSRNLKSMISRERRDRHGYTHEAMARGEVEEDFVRAVATAPEKFLEKVKVFVLDHNLSSTSGTSRYFSNEMYEDFLSVINWVQDVAPREHDATCITLTSRLRQGRNSHDLLKSNYVFVTRNSTFVRKSRDYLIQSQLLHERQESPVIHQRDLAVIAWLRTGLRSVEKIPLSSMIASCDRVLRLNPDVPNAVADRLRDAQDKDKLAQFELLLLDSKSVQKLADSTLNDVDIVTGDNAEKLLSAMKAVAIVEEQERHNRVINGLEERHSQELRQLENKIREGTSRHSEREAELKQSISTLERQIDNSNQVIESFKKERYSKIVNAANSTNKILSAFEISTLAVIVSIGVAFIFFTPYNSYVVYISKTAGVIATLYGLIAGSLEFIGKRAPGLQSISGPLCARIFKRKLKTLGIEARQNTYRIEKCRIILME